MIVIFYFLILVMPLSQHRIWAQFVGDLTGIKYIGIVCLPYAVFGRTPYYLSHWLTYTSFFVLFFITMAVVDTLSRLRWLLLTTSASLALASLYVLRDWQTF